MAREELDAVHRLLTVEVDATCAHERECAVDVASDPLVTLARRGAAYEVLVPVVHGTQVGEATSGVGTDEVERHRARGVGTHHARRVRHPCIRIGGQVVDGVAAVGRQARNASTSALRGLANWPAIRPTFTTGTLAA